MQLPGPEKEHLWLQQLIGEWSIESECVVDPDEPPLKSLRREIVRSFGSFWVVGESGENSPSGEYDAVMTLGYDAHSKRFVGTFITSMMAHLWPYSGTLDDAGKILTLDSEGPSLAGDGTHTKYQDIIEIVSADYRILTSRMLGNDGQWNHFMTAHYRKK